MLVGTTTGFFSLEVEPSKLIISFSLCFLFYFVVTFLLFLHGFPSINYIWLTLNLGNFDTVATTYIMTNTLTMSAKMGNFFIIKFNKNRKSSTQTSYFSCLERSISTNTHKVTNLSIKYWPFCHNINTNRGSNTTCNRKYSLRSLL